MIFSLCIRTEPGTASAATALAFACALPAAGHRLLRVFFQGDGVAHARPDSDWLQLQHSAGTDLIICSAAVAERRLAGGMETQLHGFAIGGLAQLMDAVVRSDRLLTFGP